MVDLVLAVLITVIVVGATIGFIRHTQRRTASGHRPDDLKTVQGWFQPALEVDELLQAAIGVSAGRKVLLLTNRSIHVVARKFWIRRFKRAYGTFVLGTVTVRFGPPGQQAGRTALEIGETAVGAIGAALATAATRSLGTLWIGDEAYGLDGVSCRMAGSVGGAEDIRLLLRAGESARAE